jgi:hypothetical protein
MNQVIIIKQHFFFITLSDLIEICYFKSGWPVCGLTVSAILFLFHLFATVFVYYLAIGISEIPQIPHLLILLFNGDFTYGNAVLL